MSIKNKITTDYYKVMELLYYNQITVNYETFVPLTQTDIAKMMNLNRMTINSIFKQLKKDELLVNVPSSTKRYFLSTKAIEIVKKIKSIK